MTGQEFCDLLEIDYDEIVEVRKPDAEDNILYFLEELLRIPETKSLIEDILASESHLAEEQIVFKID